MTRFLNGRTRLLISVTDATEAILARDNGADLIDVKDPSQGSLGAMSPSVWREVLAAVGSQVPVSAALGELTDPAALDRAPCTPGLAFAKIGLALQGKLSADHWRQRWLLWRSRLPGSVQPVMVCYADGRNCGAPPLPQLLEVVAEAAVPVVLVDTFDKRGGSLPELWGDDQLFSFVSSVRERDAQVVLAGSLRLGDLPQILRLAPDYVAVRGAVCRESRSGPIDGQLVREWSRALSTAER